MKIIGIAARDRDGFIGKNGTIPWHFKEDFQYFKKTTLGHPMIMGHTTWKSLPKKPLPGRMSIVLSRSIEGWREGAMFVSERALMDQALPAVGAIAPTLFVIGGAAIYELFAGKYDAFHLTEVNVQSAGDTKLSEDVLHGLTISERNELSANCVVHVYSK